MKNALTQLCRFYLKSGALALIFGLGFCVGVVFAAIGLGFVGGMGWINPPA